MGCTASTAKRPEVTSSEHIVLFKVKTFCEWNIIPYNDDDDAETNVPSSTILDGLTIRENDYKTQMLYFLQGLRDNGQRQYGAAIMYITFKPFVQVIASIVYCALILFDVGVFGKNAESILNRIIAFLCAGVIFFVLEATYQYVVRTLILKMNTRMKSTFDHWTSQGIETTLYYGIPKKGESFLLSSPEGTYRYEMDNSANHSCCPVIEFCIVFKRNDSSTTTTQQRTNSTTTVAMEGEEAKQGTNEK